MSVAYKFLESVVSVINQQILQNMQAASASDNNNHHRMLSYSSKNTNDTFVPGANVMAGVAMGDAGGWYALPIGGVLIPQAAVACLALGLAAMILTNLFFFFRCCFKSLRCAPKTEDVSEFEAEQIKKKGFHLYIIVWVLIAIVFLTDMLVYVGNTYFDSAIEIILDTVDTIVQIFTDMQAGGYQVSDGAYAMSDAFKNDGCLNGTRPMNDPSGYNRNDLYFDFGDQISDPIKTMGDEIVKIVSKSNMIIDLFESTKADIELYGGEYRTNFLFAMWALVFITLLILALGHGFKKKLFVQFGLFLTCLVYYISIILTFPWMFMTAYMAQFCKSPIEFLFFATDSDMKDDDLPENPDILKFYLTCNSERFGDPLSTALDAASKGLDDLKDVLDKKFTITVNNGGTDVDYDADLNSLCGNSPGGGFGLINGGVDGMSDGFDSVAAALRCSRIRDMIHKFINEGVCTEMYSGVYSIWASQLTTGFFMFFLIILSSIAYQYYAKQDVVYPTSAHALDAQNAGGRYDEFGNFIPYDNQPQDFPAAVAQSSVGGGGYSQLEMTPPPQQGDKVDI